MSDQTDYRPLERFTSKAEMYARFRPSYPKEMLEELARRGALRGSHVIADVGSGTGLLSELFIRSGHVVYGIEPNAAMRAIAERAFIGNSNFISIDARAESTTLPGSSVDLIVAGQAFHWFEPGPTKAEFKRILRKGGAVALIWNERQKATEGFLAEYEKLLDKHCERHGPMDRMNVGPDAIADFFSPGPAEKFTVPNWQDLDLEGAVGRLISSSYAPDPGLPGYDEIVADLTEIFDRYQKDGMVRFVYDTEVTLGRFDR